MIVIKVNCKYNDQGAWCKCKQVKRSLFGFGERYCIQYDGKKCEYQVKSKKPTLSSRPIKTII